MITGFKNNHRISMSGLHGLMWKSAFFVKWSSVVLKNCTALLIWYNFSPIWKIFCRVVQYS